MSGYPSVMPGRPFVGCHPSGHPSCARLSSYCLPKNRTAPPCAQRRRGGVACPYRRTSALSRNCIPPTACPSCESLRFGRRPADDGVARRHAPCIGEHRKAERSRGSGNWNRGLNHRVERVVDAECRKTKSRAADVRTDAFASIGSPSRRACERRTTIGTRLPRNPV